MKIVISKPYTVNGFKYRDVEEECEDGELSIIGQEIFTPNCGWIVDDTNPSFKCNKCDESCPEHKKWMDFYEKEGYL